MPVFTAESDELKRGAVAAEGRPGSVIVGEKLKDIRVIFDATQARLADSFWVAGLIRYFVSSGRNLLVAYPRGKSQSLFDLEVEEDK